MPARRDFLVAAGQRRLGPLRPAEAEAGAVLTHAAVPAFLVLAVRGGGGGRCGGVRAGGRGVGGDGVGGGRVEPLPEQRHGGPAVALVAVVIVVGVLGAVVRGARADAVVVAGVVFVPHQLLVAGARLLAGRGRAGLVLVLGGGLGLEEAAVERLAGGGGHGGGRGGRGAAARVRGGRGRAARPGRGRGRGRRVVRAGRRRRQGRVQRRPAQLAAGGPAVGRAGRVEAGGRYGRRGGGRVQAEAGLGDGALALPPRRRRGAVAQGRRRGPAGLRRPLPGRRVPREHVL